MVDCASKSMPSLAIDSVAMAEIAQLKHDAVDQSEPVYEELLRGLENEKLQSCTQLTRVRLADAMGLAVSDECVEDGQWQWLMIQPILWEAVACFMFILFFSHF